MANSKSANGYLIAFIILIVLFLIVRSCLCGGSESNHHSSKNKTRTEQIKECFSTWDGSHIKLEKWVKDNMNDPDSYEHIESRYDDNGATITIYLKFRGKNAFGGKVVNMAIAETTVGCDLIGTPQIIPQ